MILLWKCSKNSLLLLSRYATLMEFSNPTYQLPFSAPKGEEVQKSSFQSLWKLSGLESSNMGLRSSWYTLHFVFVF